MFYGDFRDIKNMCLIGDFLQTLSTYNERSEKQSVMGISVFFLWASGLLFSDEKTQSKGCEED